MQFINQFSVLLMLILPVGAILFWLRLRQSQPTAGWLLLGLGAISTLFLAYLIVRFQTGAGSTVAEVETALGALADGQPLFIELYSDY